MYGFDEILGNKQIKKALKASALENRPSHSYIFEGAAGSGKKMLANAFAKFVFCQTKREGCKCHSCIQFDSGNHSDLMYISTPEKEKSIGVKHIRNTIVKDISKKPFEYENKIYIIEKADLITPEAQNALLKAIEEPPSYVIFIFLSENLKSFLPTVLSRCFIYKMDYFGADYIYNHLKAQGFAVEDDLKAKIASDYCGGSIGRAKEIYDDEAFFEMRKQINESLCKIKTTNNENHDLEVAFTEMLKLERYKDNTGIFIMIALKWFRDVLIYKATNGFNSANRADFENEIIDSASSLTFKSLYIKVRSLHELNRSLSANTPFHAALDALAIKMND